jgi:hypothetical protein
MKLSNFFIAAIWLYLLIDSYFQGQAIPELVRPLAALEVSTRFVSILLSILFVLAFVLTYWQRHSLMTAMPLVTRLVDRRFGAGTYHDFMCRLRPIGISIVSALILGITGMHANSSATGSAAGYLICYVFLALAAGLLAAYLLSQRSGPALR